MSITTATVARALTPSRVRVAGRDLRPLTLAHLAATERVALEWGEDFDLESPRQVAAAILLFSLSGSEALAAVSDFPAFTAAVEKALPEVLDLPAEALAGLIGHFNAAWKTILPVASKKGYRRLSGLGLAVELADLLAHEYGQHPLDIIHDTPLPALFMFTAAIHQRNGGKFAAPDYAEKDLLNSTPEKA